MSIRTIAIKTGLIVAAAIGLALGGFAPTAQASSTERQGIGFDCSSSHRMVVAESTAKSFAEARAGAEHDAVGGNGPYTATAKSGRSIADWWIKGLPVISYGGASCRIA
jgi:hypothetical protein